MKIGLTGGIASGKSTVASLLADRGVKVLDADKIAHQLMKPKTEVWQKIVNYFGMDILQANDRIDRKQLGETIFKDQTAKQKLEEIIHPNVKTILAKRMEEILTTDQVVVAEVALLIEAEMIDLFDKIWVVYVDKAVQIERLINRTGYDQKTAETRVGSQLSLQEKVKYADRVIDNNGSPDQLEKKVEKAWQEISCELEN